MGMVKKISIGIAFIIVAVISFIIGGVSIAVVSDYMGKKFTLRVRLIEDIDLPADLYEYGKPAFKPTIEGRLLRGSIGI